MDGSIVFNLMHKIHNLKQGDLSVLDYYHKLKSLWIEFDILTTLPACVCEERIACTCDVKSGSAKHTQLIRLMQFLMGLSDVYQPIKSTILANDPLPNVKDAFYVLSREDFHRGLHFGGSSTNKSQSAAFVVKTNNNTNDYNKRVNTNKNNNTNRGPNPNLLCKNYRLISHTVDRCYELNVYLGDFKRNPNLSKQSRNNNNNNKRFIKNIEVNYSVSSKSSSLYSSFTNEQMMKLFSLINEKPSPTVNMSGIKPNFFNNNVSLKLTNFYNNNVFFNLNFKKFFYAKSKYVMYNVTLGWIIDSGANQMTDSTKDMFNIVNISSLILTVGHPNGTLAKITAISSLRLTSGIVLFNVLVVPKLPSSVLSGVSPYFLVYGKDPDLSHVSWVNERQMQTTKEKVDTSQALDVSSVDTESSRTESKEQDTSSRSGYDAHADDADIRPIYDEEPMAEVQTTAEIDVFAIGQQHTKQPKFINEGKVVQNAEECHDTYNTSFFRVIDAVNKFVMYIFYFTRLL
nr:ribonuclease H-like domain-containing protein [Tanacetum cinerariifolium]